MSKEELGKEELEKEAASDNGRVVLCGANAYEKKYYFNKEKFGNLPKSIQDELHVICVMFTEECGGIFTIVFEPDGGISMDTASDESDYYYDEISAGLMTGEIRRKRSDLLEALSMYYRTLILHEPLAE